MHRHPRLVRRLAQCAALASLAACGLARADGSGQASLSNFVFTLIDLDPGDGIAPSFTILSNGIDSTNFFAATSSTYAADTSPIEELEVGSSTDTLASTATQAGITATSSTAGGTLFARGTLDPHQIVNGQALGYHAQADLSYAGVPGEPNSNYDYYRSIANNSPAPRSFAIGSLSAHTRLEVRALADVRVDGDVACGPGCSQNIVAAATVSLYQLVDQGFGLELVPLAADHLGAAVTTGPDQWGADYDVHYTRDMVIGASNTGAGALPIYFASNVQTGGQALAAPEPGSYALVGLGLAAAAWRARRGRRA